MTNKVELGGKGRDAVLVGVDTVANAVKVTLGAKGRNVLIEGLRGVPHITKDGVTVAKSITLEDAQENIGATLIKEVANKTLEVTGDGPQPLYSKILTPYGFKTMGEMKVGMEICGTGGSIQKVDGVFPKGKKEICEVKFSDGRNVECCEDHLWNVTTAYGVKKTLTVKQLIDSERISLITNDGSTRHRYYTPKTHVEFKANNTLPIDAYLLGALLGDGSLSGTGSIELSLGFKKRHILDKIVLPKGVMYTAKDVDRKNYIRVKFKMAEENGVMISGLLDSIGLLGVKSGVKFIPKEYLYADIDTRKALLQGLLDTDGYVNKKHLFEYSTVSERLALDFIELCRGLGYSVSNKKLIRKKGSSYSETPIYRIHELKGYKHGVKMVDIKKTGKYTEMQCIKVSNPDNLYITNDYIVTHNTTTAIILAQAILEQGVKAINEGDNPVVIKKGIDKAVKHIVELIEKNSKDINTDEELLQIATISANGDSEIGELILTAIKKVGRDGIIEVQKGKTHKTTVDLVDGMEIKKGYISPYFINNHDKRTCEFENPYILLFDKKITSFLSVQNILKHCVAQNKPLLFICEDMEGDILPTLLANNQAGNIKTCAIQSFGFGNDRVEMLQDIAIATGGKFIAEEKGMRLDEALAKDLGSASRITVTKNSCLIVGGNGQKSKIQDRIKSLELLLNKSESGYAKETLKKRIANLRDGIAIIYVGGVTDTEAIEKADRIDDALCATRAAIDEGYVEGGGLALVRAKDEFLAKGIDYKDIKGQEIVLDVLTAPMKQILSNAGLEYNEKLRGYDIETGKEMDMLEHGIIDPTKVVRVALENASSIASILLTTECVISNNKPTK